MTKLSIIIVSYNTKGILEKCLRSLINNIKKYSFQSEIIVVDNGSTDGTIKLIQNLKFKVQNESLKFQIIKNNKNLGYGRANNQGIKIAQGEYILFLNSDVVVNDVNFKKILDYFDGDQKVGVMTAKVVLTSGEIDPACHRGFPTPWRAFCYFIKLEKIFGKLPILNKIFGGYHLTYLDLNVIHEIDSPSGAFYLTKKIILDKVGAFDEAFFMYGEDLDLSFRIKKAGYRIIYYPKEKVIHHKYQSGFRAKDKNIKAKTKGHFYQVMKIFYKKHYEKKYPKIFSSLVYIVISLINRE